MEENAVEVLRSLALFPPVVRCHHIQKKSKTTLIVSPYKVNNNVIPISFSCLHAFDQLVVHPLSRTVSHPKENNLLWSLSAHPPTEKAVRTG